MAEALYFSDSYNVSRLKFRGLLGAIQQHWPSARLETVPMPSEQYTVDIIASEPRKNDQLLLVTTGQHGVEGYAGGAFLQLLAREYLDKLDPKRTGLILIHAINPWGMAHFRRVNENNVDLNRNFIRDDWQQFTDLNKDYPRLRFLLEPGPLAEKGGEVAFYRRVARALVKVGSGGIKRALTLGQYQFNNGLYYGGLSYQPAVVWLIDFYKGILAENKHILHLDIHTGYGPANRMTIVNSFLEPRDTEALKKQIGYDLIVKADPEGFYDMQGDMIDYICWLKQEQFAATKLYSTCFEFGTLGDSLGGLFKSLRALIEENQLWQLGNLETIKSDAIKKQFQEAFFPSSHTWRQRVLTDSRSALTGILASEGFIR